MPKKKYIRRKITKLQSFHEEWPENALVVLSETIAEYKKRYKYVSFGITTDLKAQYDRHHKRDDISWSSMRVKFQTFDIKIMMKFENQAKQLDNYIDNNCFSRQVLLMAITN